MCWLYGTLSEKDSRRCVGIGAEKLGHGGIEYLSGLSGIDHKTVRKGLTEPVSFAATASHTGGANS